MKKFVIITAVLFWGFAGIVEAGGTVTVDKINEGYQFSEDGKPVMFYRVKAKLSEKGTHSRANYCHPVHGLDGKVITEDFPNDHLHHRGIFLAWHQVYTGRKRIRDMWDCKEFIWDIEKVKVLDKKGKSAAIKASVLWKSPQWKGGRKAFASEETSIRLFRTDDDARIIDYDITITALGQTLRLGGSENDKGYGGFSVRLKLPKDVSMNDAAGNVVPKRTAVKAGSWMNFAGSFEGEKSGVAVFVHPDNPGESVNWILRKAKSSQNIAYPGRNPIAIETGKQLRLRYRIVIHKNANLEKLFKEYTKK